MKPFNLEQALKGKKVVDGKGEEVTQIHAFTLPSGDVQIGGVQTNFRYVGVWPSTSLFMASEKKTMWANVYPGTVICTRAYLYNTQLEANVAATADRVACVKVEWEE